jgi:hypothetical protein
MMMFKIACDGKLALSLAPGFRQSNQSKKMNLVEGRIPTLRKERDRVGHPQDWMQLGHG